MNTLYVVATPIGNRADLSQRAIEILSTVPIIACEDTRRSGILLSELGITSPKLVSYFDHNERERAITLLDRMEADSCDLALISDAGTPAISDPGYHLVRLAHQRSIKVSPIPGPVAAMALVSASGLASDRVWFVGFLPNKTGDRTREFERWPAVNGAVVCYETARRCAQTLQEIFERFPEAEIAVGRELTKVYEEIVVGSKKVITTWLEEKGTILKGEVALMIVLSKNDAHVGGALSAIDQAIERLTGHGLSSKDIVEALSELSPMTRKELYKRAVSLAASSRGIDT